MDGNTNGDRKKQSCTHTDEEEWSYWRVDLGYNVSVGSVVLYNRNDKYSEFVTGTCFKTMSHRINFPTPLLARAKRD